MWTPESTYQEQLIPGKVYAGKVTKIKNMGDYFEIHVETEGGGIHSERRYLSVAARQWTERHMSGLYYATGAPMNAKIEVFTDAKAHEKNLVGRPFRFVLKQKTNKDGGESRFMEISLMARLKDELVYKKPVNKDAKPQENYFSEPTAPPPQADETDDMPF